MSSYLSFYGRLKPDLYKVERLRDKEYYKQDDVVLLDSFSRNNTIYRIMHEEINLAYCGNEEKYTVLTMEDLSRCISSCSETIKRFKEMLNEEEKNKAKYIEYLSKLEKPLTYSEFIEFMGEDYSHETKEEIENYEYCLNQLYFLQSLVESTNCGYNGFSEILCNVD